MNVALVVLIVIVLILCGGVFLLYNQEKGASNDAAAAKQAYDTLNDSYNQLSAQYATLVANNADLSGRYNQLNAQNKNVSADYASLKNQSETMTVKLGEFLESDPTVAYNYAVSSGSGANNTTVQKVVVNVYNVGTADIDNAMIRVAIKSTANNSTDQFGELTNSTGTLPSLSKHTVIFDNINDTTQVQNVTVGIA